MPSAEQFEAAVDELRATAGIEGAAALALLPQLESNDALAQTIRESDYASPD